MTVLVMTRKEIWKKTCYRRVAQGALTHNFRDVVLVGMSTPQVFNVVVMAVLSR